MTGPKLTVEEAKGLKTELEIVEGMQFDRGYLSPYFVTDADRMEAVLDDVLVLIHEKKISAMKDLLPLLEKVHEAAKPLLIIAEDIDAHTDDQSVLSYFRLCLAAHHTTVATYVPTDVDSKIRGLLWRDTKDLATLRAMAAAAMEMHTWTLDGYSLRTVDCGEHGIVSGHDYYPGKSYKQCGVIQAVDE